MTAAAVVHICEFSSTAMLLLVTDRVPENQGLDFPNLWQWHLDDFSVLSAPNFEKCKSGIVNK